MEDTEFFTSDEARAEINRLKAEEEAPKRIPKSFPADQIKVFPALFQPRTDMHQWHVKEMREAALERGKDLDPVDVILCGSTPVLVDGHHRLAAYLEHDTTAAVPVNYLKLSVDEAVEHSIRENCKSKVAINNLDRTNTAWRLVKDLDACGNPRFSKKKVVELTGTSDGSVANMRRVLKALGNTAGDYPEWYAARGAAKEKALDADKDFDWERVDISTGEAIAEEVRAQFGEKLLTRIGVAGQVAFIENLFSESMGDILQSLPLWSDQLEGANYEEISISWEEFLRSRDGF